MRRSIIALVLCAVAAVVVPAHAGSGETPPPDPKPHTAAWEIRDVQNMNHAMERLTIDQYANPAYAREALISLPGTYGTNVSRQLADPTRPILTAAQLIPGATNADPFRLHWDEQGRGQRLQFTFLNRYGARLRGNLWAPNPNATDPVTGAPLSPPYPTVLITEGSIQGYQDLYLWAAEGLAEAGYLVMTFDVQGQGESETFGHDHAGHIWCGPVSSETPPPASPGGDEQNASCPGVPFQQTANFVNGTEDALDFLFSTPSHPYRWFRSGAEGLSSNPWSSWVDTAHVGLAGHSLGASAISIVQAYDTRVQTVVAWDNLSSDVTPRVPAMGQTADYLFNVQPTLSMPAPKDLGFQAWKKAGIDSMEVSLVGSTHLEFSYVPTILPASQDGERVAMYYTLAWFDRYLKGATDATQRDDAMRRLTALVFDGSADRSAIGTGSYDVATNSNAPHHIAGDHVWEHLSFYEPSDYWLDAGALQCADMRRDPRC